MGEVENKRYITYPPHTPNEWKKNRGTNVAQKCAQRRHQLKREKKLNQMQKQQQQQTKTEWKKGEESNQQKCRRIVVIRK